MNMKNPLRLAAVALVILTSFNAYAQSSDATTTTTPSASAGTSKSSMRKANRALGRKVTQALEKSGIDLVGIHVVARNGVVTLTGQAADQSQIDKATSVAKGVSGVSSVKNVLTIQEGGQ